MGIRDDVARRKAEAAFSEQLAAHTLARKASANAADRHQSLLARIAQQRGLRLRFKMVDDATGKGKA